MKHRVTQRHFLAGLVMLTLAPFSLGQQTLSPDTVKMDSHDSSAEVSSAGWVITAKASNESSLVLTPKDAPSWDLTKFQTVSFQVTNKGKNPLEVWGKLENENAKGIKNTCANAVVIDPGESKTLETRIVPTPVDPGFNVLKPFLMYEKRMAVFENSIDASTVARIRIAIAKPKDDDVLLVKSIAFTGTTNGKQPDFYPFVDSYGQYIHSDWPGKIRSDADFKARRDEEDRDLATHPGPTDWDEYGGWKTGPSQRATGFFYPTKINSKWWLVDPKGKLYFSYGPTGVGIRGDLTPFTERETAFDGLPARNTDVARFYGKGHGATYMFYEKKDWEGYDFGAANLFKKYGPNYEKIVAERMHHRLRNWGFNTIANWSAEEVYGLRKTPYTVAIHFGSPMLYRMHDAFNPDFRKNLARRMKDEIGKTAGDPWNLGYFVDNELWWGYWDKAGMVSINVLKENADFNAKIEFIKDLKKKYGSIDKLNKSWNTDLQSWDAFASKRDFTEPKKEDKDRLDDYNDFGMKFARQYFSIVREEVKRVAPNNLYLGCRFHGHIDPNLMKLAGEYCDVISYNVYDDTPAGRMKQYMGKVDKPFIMSEFGLGSDPTQTPWRGDAPTEGPNDRARKLTAYVEAAFDNPLIVGAHFFQFRDQPVSGRPDGEAVLRGVINIADTPHFDLIQANRKLAEEMYNRRAGK